MHASGKSIGRRALKFIAAAALVAGVAGALRAAITVRSYYRLGEDDTPAVVIGANAQLVGQDSSGNAIHLDRPDTNPPTYGTAAPMFFAGITPAQQSSVSGNFNAYGTPPEGYWRFNTMATTATNNVGFEHWVRMEGYPTAVASFDQFAIPFANGDIFSNGYSLTIGPTGNVFIAYPGAGSAFTGYNLPLNQWHHLAVVIDAGTSRFFVDGTQAFSNSAILPLTPAGYTAIGGGPGYYPFHGLIDEVRLFTFAAGEFSVGDLLVPEPTGACAMLVSLVALVRRRK